MFCLFYNITIQNSVLHQAAFRSRIPRYFWAAVVLRSLKQLPCAFCRSPVRTTKDGFIFSEWLYTHIWKTTSFIWLYHRKTEFFWEKETFGERKTNIFWCLSSVMEYKHVFYSLSFLNLSNILLPPSSSLNLFLVYRTL